MYDRYDKSRVYQNIGGPMDYYIIRKNGAINPNVDKSQPNRKKSNF